MNLIVDDLSFEVRRSSRRASVQITVERAGNLVISAPERCDDRAMETFVREKRFWIYTKLAEKDALGPPTPSKRYVSGEGFPYLGRNYRLLLVKAQEVPLKLEHGRFKLRRADARLGRAHMLAWYAQHARPWLENRVHRFAGRVGVQPAGVTVQDLGYRWGSCGKRGQLHFHWRAILLPPRVVEYVVVHELVHLREQHHTPAFWVRVERALPDYAARKQWLAEHAGEVAAV